MATVPIVTEVTFAQLEAVVAENGLNEGLQYKVTDKDWLLVATSQNTLKAATGRLYTNNDVVDMSFIFADDIIIEVAIVGDITYGTGTPLAVNIPLDYYPVRMITNMITMESGIPANKIILQDGEGNDQITVNSILNEVSIGSNSSPAIAATSNSVNYGYVLYGEDATFEKLNDGVIVKIQAIGLF
jgi:hypothetical protein